MKLVQAASSRNYCVYMYTNLKGGEGNRLYFDGNGMIVTLGELVAQAPQFTIDDVDVTVANLDLDKVRGERMKTGSHGSQTGTVEPFERVLAPINICQPCKPT